MDELWALEEGWWLRGPAEARRVTHPACLMGFGFGLMQGEAIFAGLDAAPRWTGLAMTDRHGAEADGLVVLGYRADARRADGSTHAAVCTSTWTRGPDGGWRLIQHQQTPPQA